MWSEIKPAPKPKNRNAKYSRVHKFPALIAIYINVILLKFEAYVGYFMYFVVVGMIYIPWEFLGKKERILK